MDVAELIGSAPNPLDRKLAVTFFADAKAQSCERQSLSLRELSGHVHSVEKAAKSQLPLLKLAQFGEVRSERGAIRHNSNVQAVDGIEGDHDAGTLSINDGADRL